MIKPNTMQHREQNTINSNESKFLLVKTSQHDINEQGVYCITPNENILSIHIKQVVEQHPVLAWEVSATERERQREVGMVSIPAIGGAAIV